MRNYLHKSKMFRFAPAIVMAVALIMGSCKDVDSTLGTNLIDDDQKLKTRIAKFVDLVDTYQSKADSMQYTNQGAIILGSTNDPVFGKTTSGAVLQYYPTPFKEADYPDYYGYNPKVDSAHIVLCVLYLTKNDKSIEQTFNVYKMTDRLKYDSIYPSNPNLVGKYDEAKPLFSFNMKDIILGYHSMKLTPTPEGEAFLATLVNADKALYADSAAYRDQFKGFYIAPAPGSPISANLFSITLYSETSSGSGVWQTDSDFELYVHNYDKTTGLVQDTIRKAYHFMDNRIGFKSLSLTNTERDYTGSEAALTPITKFDSTPPVDATTAAKLYLQCGEGLYPYIYINDQLLAAIQALKPTPYYDIVINEATIKFPLTYPTIDNMNSSIGRIGMYSSYKNIFPSIPDYDYYGENMYGNTIHYDGTLNHAKREYSMNISSYLTKLLREQDPDQPTPLNPINRTIALGGDFNSLLWSHEKVVLSGKGAPVGRQIELNLIYTLVKKP